MKQKTASLQLTEVTRSYKNGSHVGSAYDAEGGD